MAGKGSPKGVRQGGRKKGTPNKATADIKAAAQLHGTKAIKRLHYLMEHADSQAVQVSAIKELLDRGYGKAAQPLTGEGGGPIEIVTQAQRDAAVQASYRADR